MLKSIILVASFTDAWIETMNTEKVKPWDRSHLLQMRGLKPGEKIIESMNVKSHLLQMRGLKL